MHYREEKEPDVGPEDAGGSVFAALAADARARLGPHLYSFLHMPGIYIDMYDDAVRHIAHAHIARTHYCLLARR